MRRSSILLSFIVITLGIVPAMAQQDSLPPIASPATEAAAPSEPLSDDALMSLMEEGSTAYGEQDYPRAISIYSRALAGAEKPTAELYYNIASAYYKSGQLAQAILNFERAYRLDPSDADTEYNLSFLYGRTAEQIEAPRTKALSRAIDQASHGLSLTGWMTLTIISFVLLVALALLFALGRSVRMRRWGFYGGLAALLLCILFNLFFARSYHFVNDRSEAILTAPIVTLKSSPDASAEDIAVVHEGHKVTVRDRLGEYSEVRLADGTVGWIPIEDYETIYDFDDVKW